MTNKWTLLCLAALLTIMGFPSPSANAAATAFGLDADRSEVAAGDTVRLTVSGKGLSDVYGYEAVVTFDTDQFTFVSARNALPKGSAGESNGFSITPVISGNEVTFAHTKVGRISGVSGDQPLAVFVFQAKKAGERIHLAVRSESRACRCLGGQVRAIPSGQHLDPPRQRGRRAARVGPDERRRDA
ncbi:cohesin domain-containing protein [Cohnella rhizosphaerae]|uniref:Cohesin domain-containing protein n=1 Tax=Cohnella rhizosphaerae TaxID=1457232 RepID=A0A9X4QVT8_9BACL|nr:cohesin domain-containing protein [Cohnella rhizosphaerae]MDG0812803.1 cohesin domain-containing protein [Cohnella rhizosphaerae]